MDYKAMPSQGEAPNKSLYNILQEGKFVQTSIEQEFIAKAFFLPREVLHSNRWKIEPIAVCTGDEWQQAEEYLKTVPGNVSICYDPNSEEIIKAAKHVGVSARRHMITNQTFFVVKLWYGEGSKRFAATGTVVKKKHSIAAVPSLGEEER